ncbi:MAG: acyl-CoA dehydrogenase [Bacillaceae bacterium]|nr:acyl-CoA dehydrogenase [Bacillaceae bacterium]
MFDEKIIEKIRNQSAQIEQSGRLSDDVLDFIYEKKLFKLFVPDELGGNMTALPQALRIFEEVSRIDGNFGWAVTIGSGGGYFAAFMNEDVSRGTYTNKKAVIAGSGYPSGVARREPGGYRVSGQWKFCSGSSYATTFTANCLIENEGSSGEPKIRSFMFRPEQVRIIEDWTAFGLKATESHSIKVEDVYVPEERTFDLMGPRIHFHEQVIYQFPFQQFAETSFAAVCIGLTRHFIEESRTWADRNQKDWEASILNRYECVNERINEAEARFSQEVEAFYQMVDRSWENFMQTGKLTGEEQQQITRRCKQLSRVSLNAAQSVFPYLGIQVIMEEHPVNRTYRDLHTACQHTMLVPFGD